MPNTAVLQADKDTFVKNVEGNTATQTWYVTVASKTSRGFDALEDLGLPAMNSNHPDDFTIQLKTLTPARTKDSQTLWEVVGNYSSETTDDDSEDPLQDPTDVSWGHSSYGVVADKDQDDASISNTAEDSFDPPLEKEVFRLQVTISKNLASFNAADALAYVGSVNKAQVQIQGLLVAARSARFVEWSATKQWRNGTSFWRQVQRIEMERDQYDFVVLQQGYNEIVDSVKSPIMVGGKVASSPQLLNNNGAALAFGGTPKFGTFRVYEETAWGSLGLNL